MDCPEVSFVQAMWVVFPALAFAFVGGLVVGLGYHHKAER